MTSPKARALETTLETPTPLPPTPYPSAGPAIHEPHLGRPQPVDNPPTQGLTTMDAASPIETDLFGLPALERRASDGLTRTDGGSDEWLTPPELIRSLGHFDLDPCSPGTRRPWDTADTHYDAKQNGLRMPWFGRVWLNPPYSDAGRWLARLADHGTGTALIFARTETGTWFDHVWPRASGLLFLRGRLSFHHVDGSRAKANADAPSVLVAYGPDDAEQLTSCGIAGHFTPGGAR